MIGRVTAVRAEAWKWRIAKGILWRVARALRGSSSTFLERLILALGSLSLGGKLGS